MYINYRKCILIDVATYDNVDRLKMLLYSIILSFVFTDIRILYISWQLCTLIIVSDNEVYFAELRMILDLFTILTISRTIWYHYLK